MFARLPVCPFARFTVCPFPRLPVCLFGCLAVWPFGRSSQALYGSRHDPSPFTHIQLPSASPPPCHPRSAKTFINYVPGDTHNLQRSTGYQFSSDRYYILCYCQQYISGYDFNHLSKMFQKEFKVTLRMIALFEYSSQ